MLCRVIQPTTENWTPGKSWYVVWYAVTAPMNAETVATSGTESTPICRIWAIVNGRYVFGSTQRPKKIAMEEHALPQLPEYRHGEAADGTKEPAENPVAGWCRSGFLLEERRAHARASGITFAPVS